MTDKLLCPFCQQELRQGDSWTWGCINDDCETAGTMCGTKELWQDFIRTHKALEVAVDALKTIKYRNETYNRDDSPDCIDATLALDQITALEQRDK